MLDDLFLVICPYFSIYHFIAKSIYVKFLTNRLSFELYLSYNPIVTSTKSHFLFFSPINRTHLDLIIHLLLRLMHLPGIFLIQAKTFFLHYSSLKF